MKFIILVICLLAVQVYSRNTCTRKTFDDWKLKYNKEYASLSEESARFNTFCATHKRIDYLNKNMPKAKFAHNEFSDLTPEEFAKHKGLLQNKQVLAQSCLANGVTYLPKLNKIDVPKSFDWRQKGVVNPVKDQGQCGGCWAFSTAGVLESALAIKTGKLLSLSEQQLIDCSHGCANEPPYGSVCNQGCDGGWPWSAMQDIMSWGGLMLESQYPYTAQTGQCQINWSNPPKLNAPITNYTCISSPGPANEETMAAYLVEHGPISIGINAAYLQTYYEGIIDPWWNTFECDPTQLDHAIIIVGYGVDHSVIWGDTPYWIVRNSWSSSWGEDGYFRIVRGSGACGLNNAVSAPLM